MQRLLDSAFLKLVSNQLANDWIGLITMTLLAGASDTMLLIIINASSGEAIDGEVNPAHLVMFLSVLMIHGMTRYSMLLRSGRAMKNIVYDFRTRICERMSQVSLQDFEQLGKPDIQLVLGRDIGLLSTPSAHFFSVPATLITTTLSLMYLCYLSVGTFAIVLLLNIAYSLFFLEYRMKTMETMNIGGKIEGDLFRKISHLSFGFKELKMHRPRRDALIYQHLFPVAEDVRGTQHRINQHLATNFSVGDVYYYFAIGVTLFVLPSLQVLVGSQAASAITVMIFLFGNLGEILFAFTILMQYDVAVDRLQKLEKSLERPAPDENATESLRLMHETRFERLKLAECVFSYHDAKGNAIFKVGPIDLTITQGELLFIVGGNGSGKSTLLRMLCGLYLPETGSLTLNDVPITANNVDRFRQYFSTVFTDFHLFDLLYGLENVPEARVLELQKRFMLDHKTYFSGQQFSTLDLSTGQRKRIALLTAILEDRPIMILDEVSADQDPEFRRFYYDVLLPELKSMGKTVLVVSHDDRFFDRADRVLYMDYGLLDQTRTFKAEH